jgi:hypothetical protein
MGWGRAESSSQTTNYLLRGRIVLWLKAKRIRVIISIVRLVTFGTGLKLIRIKIFRDREYSFL